MTTTEPLHRACREGDEAEVARILGGVDDAAVQTRVERIGGLRAMTRFLLQRRHWLVAPTVDLDAWLVLLLRAAEPMHLLDLRGDLATAEAAGHEAIAKRVKDHLQFEQPPDPTRWSRPVPSECAAALLEACRRGDIAEIERCLALDPAAAFVRALDGRDPLDLYPGEASALVALGIVRRKLDDAWRELDDAVTAGDLARLEHRLDEVYQHRNQILLGGPPGRPLHLAAYHDRPELLLPLLSRGYSPAQVHGPRDDLGAVDTANRTPLSIAVERGHQEVHRVLMNGLDFFQGRRARRK